VSIKSSLKQEKKLWKLGHQFVIGLDEAGRGALAGPVFAAAVFLKFPFLRGYSSILRIMNLKVGQIRDSKKLTKDKREKIFKIIKSSPFIEYRASGVSERVIDKINIKNASELAMQRCVQKLKIETPFLIIDGRHINSKRLKRYPHKLIVKADEKIFSCALASVIAKVLRDRAMQKLAKTFPRYYFEKNKGYPTKKHLYFLKKYGPCRVHRKSFLPVKNFNR